MMQKEHAEHISDNGKIAIKEEDFALLSRDMNDMIKTFGTNKKIISRLLSNVRSR
jgi:hypothetical protein